MFSCSKWEGLAKIGQYETNGRKMMTPALFPVVDPYQQSFPISDFKTIFGFDQVITSAYLMSKRFAEKSSQEVNTINWNDMPNVHEYLNFDGIIMMDSGAYQIMLYGDIELGVKDTLDLQMAVKPDIGVLMDHPIGYQTTFREAKSRIDTTLTNLKTSLSHFSTSQINWTLPIQGGKYISLLDEYLDQVVTDETLNHFGFFALGSVVPVMINQDYETLVKMIAHTRRKLPVTYPLHLFGAGHPSMFALAVFLGCDTFDSAAYALMAKDNRYMTVDGTYNLTDLEEFPCSCRVCTSYSPGEFRKLDASFIREELTKHNLWVSIEEIRRIRNAIRDGRLWELVLQRSASVPRLARATRLALDYVTTGDLSKLYRSGVPVSSTTALRIARKRDISRIELKMVHEESSHYIEANRFKEIVIIANPMHESIYNRLPDNEIGNSNLPSSVDVFLHLPPFGILPLAFNERYPVAQLVHDLEILDFGTLSFQTHIKQLKASGVEKIQYIVPKEWPHEFEDLLQDQDVESLVYREEKPLSALKRIYS